MVEPNTCPGKPGEGAGKTERKWELRGRCGEKEKEKERERKQSLFVWPWPKSSDSAR